MTRGLPAKGHAAEVNELLARLGLPASASPEDVDDLHQAVSQYLTSAPPSIRGWAHAQAAALDQAYLLLTDPVGLEGSALMSPDRPPMVVPGGPATPPARRGPAPAADFVFAAAEADEELEDEPLDDEDPSTATDQPTAPAVVAATVAASVGASVAAEQKPDEADLDDLAVLYASVTPSAHRDTLPGARAKAPAAQAAVVTAPRPVRGAARSAAIAAPVAPQAANPWKRLVLAGVAVIVVAGVGFGAIQLVGGIGGTPTASGNVADASAAPPAVDEAKVAELMAKLQANPKDTATLLALANEYYAGEQYATAAEFLDKLLAIEPENIQALLARGAVSFNLNDLAAAEATWLKVAALEPSNVEVHYDLGFLYLNQTTPDWAGVQREWGKVIELDPTSQLAQTVKSHLDSLAANSMLPAGSPGASASAGPAASASPASSATPAASATPGASASAPASSQP